MKFSWEWKIFCFFSLKPKLNECFVAILTETIYFIFYAHWIGKYLWSEYSITSILFIDMFGHRLLESSLFLLFFSYYLFGWVVSTKLCFEAKKSSKYEFHWISGRTKSDSSAWSLKLHSDRTLYIFRLESIWNKKNFLFSQIT